MTRESASASRLSWVYERIGQFACWCGASVGIIAAGDGVNGGDGMFAGFLISGVVLRATMILRKKVSDLNA